MKLNLSVFLSLNNLKAITKTIKHILVSSFAIYSLPIWKCTTIFKRIGDTLKLLTNHRRIIEILTAA